MATLWTLGETVSDPLPGSAAALSASQIAAVQAVDRSFALFGKGPCDEAIPLAPDMLRLVVLTAVGAYAESLAREIERQMATPAKGCGCPPEHQRNCGWRAGMGFAADLLREDGDR